MEPELGWRGLVAGRAGDQEGQNSQTVQVCTMHFPEAVAGQAGGDFLGGASREEKSSGKGLLNTMSLDVWSFSGPLCPCHVPG